MILTKKINKMPKEQTVQFHALVNKKFLKNIKTMCLQKDWTYADFLEKGYEALNEKDS